MQNSVNMVVSVGLGPSCTSWMAPESTNEGQVVFLNSVLGGTIVEAKESTVGVDSSSKTPRRRTLELATRIGQ